MTGGRGRTRISWHFTEDTVFSPGFWYRDWGDPVNEAIITLTQAVSMADTPMWCIHEHGLVLRRIVAASERLLDDLDQALSHDFDEPRPVAADSPLAATVLAADQSLHHAYILLVDALVDSLTDLVRGGAIWLLTPKVGRPGAVDAADVAEAAPIAGLSTTTTVAVGKDWTATRLVAPKN